MNQCFPSPSISLVLLYWIRKYFYRERQNILSLSAPSGRRLAFVAGMKRNGKRRFPVLSSRAQPRDLFRFPLPFSFVKLLHETPSFLVAWRAVLPAIRSPHVFCLTANEKDFSHSLEMTMQGSRHSPSFLWKEVPRRGGGWLML